MQECKELKLRDSPGIALTFDFIKRWLSISISNFMMSMNFNPTNGFQQLPKTAQQLLDLKVGWGQVTLEGPGEIHNARRSAVGRQPTFDKILTNIAALGLPGARTNVCLADRASDLVMVPSR